MKTLLRLTLLFAAIALAAAIGMMPNLQSDPQPEESKVNQAMPETKALD